MVGVCLESCTVSVESFGPYEVFDVCVSDEFGDGCSREDGFIWVLIGVIRDPYPGVIWASKRDVECVGRESCRFIGRAGRWGSNAVMIDEG